MTTTSRPADSRSTSRLWLRALELTAPIAKNPARTLPTVIQDLAEQHENTPALVSENESFTYGFLADRANRYAQWALDQQLEKGDVVCLYMSNRPEYMAIWLGITRVGCVVSLLNTNLTGASLAHCIDTASPKHIIAESSMVDSLITAMPVPKRGIKVWCHGKCSASLPRIDERIDIPLVQPRHSLSVSIHDTALYIYTSGTTGMPKAAKVSHYRLMQWTHWFAGLMEISPDDKMYNCLPMYHSVGGVVATGAVLVGAGSVVVRDRFSAREFWTDIARWNCTMFQYIGEICRYLLHSGVSESPIRHRIRMCCGNGLRSDIWKEFKERFRIPKILEFYASTEGTFSLFNVEGQPGAIGRVPAFLAHRFPARLVQFDFEANRPYRNQEGFCVPCNPNDVGEALGLADDLNAATRFDGYSKTEESEGKVLRDVFEPGDKWIRTGDLMRQDERGFFYFVDRIGDTFRWKGENVSTTEVEEAMCAFLGVKDAAVYGVHIPGSDGQAGMAAIAACKLDLAALQSHLADRLPRYARPIFVRVRSQLDVTATFKHQKSSLVRESYNPDNTTDAIYFNDPARGQFVTLDKALFDRIQTGQIPL